MTPEEIDAEQAAMQQHDAEVAALIARIEGERDAALAASARDRAARNRGRFERDRLRRELAAFRPAGSVAPGETPALCPTCTEVLCVPGLPGCARCTRAEVARLRGQGDELRATAHGLGRDYRQARAELDTHRNALGDALVALPARRTWADLIGKAVQLGVALKDAMDVASRNARLQGEAEAERDRRGEQVRRVRARHYGQCGGVCAAVPCECEPGDLLCDECETPYPCPTVLDLDRAESTPDTERDGGGNRG